MGVEQEKFIASISKFQETQKPKIKLIESKTPKMREVERGFERIFAGFGVPIHIPIELILYTLYLGDKPRNKADIARFIKRVTGVRVGEHAVGEWLKTAGIESRVQSEAARLSWENPKTRERRVNGIKEAWRKKREEIIAGVEKVVEERRKRVRRGVEQKLEVLAPERRTTRGRLRLLLVREGTKEKVARRLGIQRDRLNQLLTEEEIDFKYSPGARLSEENAKVVGLAGERRILEKLTPLQRKVINLRYREDNQLTLREIGRRLGRTKQAISEIEQTALRRLRRKLDLPD